MRYELTDLEWAAIKLLLPNEPRATRSNGPQQIKQCQRAATR